MLGCSGRAPKSSSSCWAWWRCWPALARRPTCRTRSCSFSAGSGSASSQAAGPRAGPRRPALRLPAAAALLGGVVVLGLRAARQRAPDRAAGDRARTRYHRRGRRRRALIGLRGRAPLCSAPWSARPTRSPPPCDRPPGRPRADPDDPRGRVARQRRYRPDRVRDGGVGRRGPVFALGSAATSCSWRPAASRSASRPAGCSAPAEAARAVHRPRALDPHTLCRLRTGGGASGLRRPGRGDGRRRIGPRRSSWPSRESGCARGRSGRRRVPSQLAPVPARRAPAHDLVQGSGRGRSGCGRDARPGGGRHGRPAGLDVHRAGVARLRMGTPADRRPERLCGLDRDAGRGVARRGARDPSRRPASRIASW